MAKTITFAANDPEYAGKNIWHVAKDYLKEKRSLGYDGDLTRSDIHDSEGNRVKAYTVRTSEAPTPKAPTASEALEGAVQAEVRKAAARAGREIGEEAGEEEFGPTRFGERRRAEEEKERAERERIAAAEREEELKRELRSADPIASAAGRAATGAYKRATTKKPKKTAKRGRVLYDRYGKAIVVEGLKSKKSGWRSELSKTGKLGKKRDTKALTGYRGLSRKFGSPRTKMSVMPGTPRIAQTGGGMPKIAELGMSRRPRIASDPDLSSMRGMSWPPQEGNRKEVQYDERNTI